MSSQAFTNVKSDEARSGESIHAKTRATSRDISRWGVARPRLHQITSEDQGNPNRQHKIECSCQR